MEVRPTHVLIVHINTSSIAVPEPLPSTTTGNATTAGAQSNPFQRQETSETEEVILVNRKEWRRKRSSKGEDIQVGIGEDSGDDNAISNAATAAANITDDVFLDGVEKFNQQDSTPSNNYNKYPAVSSTYPLAVSSSSSQQSNHPTHNGNAAQSQLPYPLSNNSNNDNINSIESTFDEDIKNSSSNKSNPISNDIPSRIKELLAQLSTIPEWIPVTVNNQSVASPNENDILQAQGIQVDSNKSILRIPCKINNDDDIFEILEKVQSVELSHIVDHAEIDKWRPTIRIRPSSVSDAGTYPDALSPSSSSSSNPGVISPVLMQLPSRTAVTQRRRSHGRSIGAAPSSATIASASSSYSLTGTQIEDEKTSQQYPITTSNAAQILLSKLEKDAMELNALIEQMKSKLMDNPANQSSTNTNNSNNSNNPSGLNNISNSGNGNDKPTSLQEDLEMLAATMRGSSKSPSVITSATKRKSAAQLQQQQVTFGRDSHALSLSMQQANTINNAIKQYDIAEIISLKLTPKKPMVGKNLRLTGLVRINGSNKRIELNEHMEKYLHVEWERSVPGAMESVDFVPAIEGRQGIMYTVVPSDVGSIIRVKCHLISGSNNNTIHNSNNNNNIKSESSPLKQNNSSSTQQKNQKIVMCSSSPYRADVPRSLEVKLKQLFSKRKSLSGKNRKTPGFSSVLVSVPVESKLKRMTRLSKMSNSMDSSATSRTITTGSSSSSFRPSSLSSASLVELGIDKVKIKFDGRTLLKAPYLDGIDAWEDEESTRQLILRIDGKDIQLCFESQEERDFLIIAVRSLCALSRFENSIIHGLTEPSLPPSPAASASASASASSSSSVPKISGLGIYKRNSDLHNRSSSTSSLMTSCLPRRRSSTGEEAEEDEENNDRSRVTIEEEDDDTIGLSPVCSLILADSFCTPAEAGFKTRLSHATSSSGTIAPTASRNQTSQISDATITSDSLVENTAREEESNHNMQPTTSSSSASSVASSLTPQQKKMSSSSTPTIPETSEISLLTSSQMPINQNLPDDDMSLKRSLNVIEQNPGMLPNDLILKIKKYFSSPSPKNEESKNAINQFEVKGPNKSSNVDLLLHNETEFQEQVSQSQPPPQLQQQTTLFTDQVPSQMSDDMAHLHQQPQQPKTKSPSSIMKKGNWTRVASDGSGNVWINSKTGWYYNNQTQLYFKSLDTQHELFTFNRQTGKLERYLPPPGTTIASG